MATNITKTTDYVAVGEFSVSVNTNETGNLLSTITNIERVNLTDLLGARLYNTLQTDLAILGTGVATAQKWIDFLTGVSYIDPSDSNYDINFDGITRGLKGFVFYDYINVFQFKRTSTGVRTVNAENSSALERSKVNGIIEPKYNQSIDLYALAQHFINDFEDYTVTSTGIVESPALTYTVSLTDTKYLANGDTVTIEDVDYTVAGLVADTSFTFTAGAGLTFTDLDVLWHPFIDFKPILKQYLPFA